MSQIDIIANETASTDQVTYKSIEVDGLNIAYRQSGDPANPKLVLLHGFDYYGLPETEKPLIGFFGHHAIRGIYLHGGKASRPNKPG